MRKWILLAIFNWFRKPANRAKARDAWRGFRGKPPKRPAGRQPAARHPTRRPDGPPNQSP